MIKNSSKHKKASRQTRKKTEPCKASSVFCLVPSARLELAQLSPLPPQDSVSTNFTTTASISKGTHVPNKASSLTAMGLL